MTASGFHLGHFVSLGIGGADRAAFHLASGLQELGVRQTVFYGENSVPRKETITSDQDPKAPVHSIESQYLAAGISLIKVQSMEEILDYGVDILQTHRSGEDSWLLPNIDKPQKNLIVVETNFHGILESHADYRVFPSKTLMSFKSIRETSRSLVIPNPVMFPSTDENFRDILGLRETMVLGRVGRSDRSIYSPKLLIAFRSFLRKFPRSTLVWIGASSQAKRDAAILGLQNVLWVDSLSNQEVLSKWFNTMDIFCHVNKLGETFGNTVAEAMSHGLPVVSLRGDRRYPQAQEEVLGCSDEVTSSTGKFVDVITKLARDSAERSRVGDRNSRRAMQEFTRGAVSKRYLELYNSVN